MPLQLNRLINADCIAGMNALPEHSIDLAFADPPFNIGYKYDVYEDKKAADEYLDWTRSWGKALTRILKPNATFWLAIGDDFAAELKLIFQRELGLTCRSWVIWYYTFGVNCKAKFSRSHTHLFHFVKDPKNFTFNADSKAVRVPSARQLVYADARANSKGRLPDDTWILRPQDIPDSFDPAEDTWYYPRVCGTFKERAGFHGCQMPEQLLGRIIKVSSNPGELVLEPFAGSGSTLIVAKKLHRNFIGFELSKNYAEKVQARLDAITPGDPLNGVPNPLHSVPTTANGKKLEHKLAKKRKPKTPNETPSFLYPLHVHSKKGCHASGHNLGGQKHASYAYANPLHPLAPYLTTQLFNHSTKNFPRNFPRTNSLTVLIPARAAPDPVFIFIEKSHAKTPPPRPPPRHHYPHRARRQLPR